MAERPEQEDEQAETDGKASTPQLDRLERLANAAATAAQASSGGRAEWPASARGTVRGRNLSHNDEARARAEEAMRQMMAKPQSKRRGW